MTYDKKISNNVTIKNCSFNAFRLLEKECKFDYHLGELENNEVGLRYKVNLKKQKIVDKHCAV